MILNVQVRQFEDISKPLGQWVEFFSSQTHVVYMSISYFLTNEQS
jgi:hypothetical protein